MNSFSDAYGGITRHPFKAAWPQERLTTIACVAAGDYTQVTVEWLPLNALPNEKQTIASPHESMQQGWSGTFGRLNGHLAVALLDVCHQRRNSLGNLDEPVYPPVGG